MGARWILALAILALGLPGCIGGTSDLAKDVQQSGPLYAGLGPDAAGPTLLAKGKLDYEFPVMDPAAESPSSTDILMSIPANATHIALDQTLTYTGWRYSVMSVFDPEGNLHGNSGSCQGIGAYTRPDIDQAKACHVDLYSESNETAELPSGDWTIRLQWNDLVVIPGTVEKGTVSWLVDNSPRPEESEEL